MLVNKANLVHNFSQYVYFFSLHVLGDYVPIIRRNNCIYETLGTCYSVWMTVWYTRWMTMGTVARNMQRSIIILRNKHTKKNCVSSWLYLHIVPTDRKTWNQFPITLCENAVHSQSEVLYSLYQPSFRNSALFSESVLMHIAVIIYVRALTNQSL